MAKKMGFYALSFLIALSLSVVVIPVKAGAEGIEGLKFFGDARARFEKDTRTNSSYVDQERDRFRYRLRAGFTYNANENVEIGGRLSSGDTNDANSPHVIFGSSNNSDSDSTTQGFTRDTVSIDKAYVKGKYRDGFLTIGKDSMPLWKQNEYFWDDDINPEGIGLGYTLKELGPLSVTLQGGYFIVDEGGWYSTDKTDGDKDLVSYQGVVKGGFDFADFVVGYESLSTPKGVTIRSQNSVATPDATNTLTAIQVKIKAISDIPITVGYDLMKASGKDIDAITTSKLDSGSVLNVGASYKNFSLLVMMPDIESNAVTAFAQDDWPNYYSNFKGTEARLGYKIAKNINVDFRYFSGERKTDTKQKEARNQINFNVSF